MWSGVALRVQVGDSRAIVDCIPPPCCLSGTVDAPTRTKTPLDRSSSLRAEHPPHSFRSPCRYFFCNPMFGFGGSGLHARRVHGHAHPGTRFAHFLSRVFSCAAGRSGPGSPAVTRQSPEVPCKERFRASGAGFSSRVTSRPCSRSSSRCWRDEDAPRSSPAG